MNIAVCPHCGFDLDRFEAMSIGDLALSQHEICWKGRRVPLRPSGRMLVSAIARARGVPITRGALTEILGCEDASNPNNVVAVHLSHARRAFREVDPAFSALESVHSSGIRWAA